MQAGWWIYYGYYTVLNVVRISSGKPDCFLDVGAYKVCDVTQTLSIYSSLMMLVTQAMISRLFVPGMSSFVNASVSVIYDD
jgi:hypothetical protein